MAKELFPSSYQCDCGHQSDFFENTVRELKQKSMKRKIYLVDGESEEHTIVFYKGEMVEIICPKTTSRCTMRKHTRSHEQGGSAEVNKAGKIDAQWKK